MGSKLDARQLENIADLIIALCIVIAEVIVFLILIAGITSTVIDWVPQPSLDILTVAFAVAFVKSVGLSVVRIGRSVLQLSSLPGVLLVAGVTLVIVVPFLYILIYSLEILWAEISTYEAHAAFFFVVALLAAQMVPSKD